MSSSRASLTIVIVVAVALAALSGVRFVQASEGHPGLPVGSWSVEVWPDPGSPIPPSLNFAALTADGILINSNMIGATAIGGWRKVGPKSYATTFTGFDVIGDQAFRYVVRGLLDLSLDGATLDGPFVTDLYTAEGTHIASVTGTVHCERLAVQPMP
jgi:hypothetical protein